MDTMTFISSLASSLAWPISAVAIVCIFKEGILSRLPDLSKLSLPGGISAEFNKELARAEAAAPALPAVDLNELPVVEATKLECREEPGDAYGPVSRQPTIPTTTDLREFFSEISAPNVEDATALKYQPTGVIMESWKALESALRSLAPRPEVTSSGRIKRLSAAQIVELLKASSVLDSTDADTVMSLLTMRNMAAHSEEKIPPEDARRFQRVAKKLEITLRSRSA